MRRDQVRITQTLLDNNRVLVRVIDCVTGETVFEQTARRQDIHDCSEHDEVQVIRSKAWAFARGRGYEVVQ